MKIIKRLFWLTLILLVGFVCYSQYKGIPILNYEETLESARIDIAGLVNRAKEWKETTENEKNENQIVQDEGIEKNQAVKNKEPVKSKKRIRVPRNPFSLIDKHAYSCSNTAETSIQSLANYLEQKSTTDLEKSRAIYIWLCDNIKYDDDGYNSGSYSGTSAEEVLMNRKSVCEGYSNLYLALGLEMNLEIKKISGYSKGYGYRQGERFSASNHAWNAINVNGSWRIFDATWGAGNGKNIKGKLVSTKAFDDYWFNVDPYEAIFNHYPENKELGFVSPMISKAQYEDFPYIEKGFFQIQSAGQEIYELARTGENSYYPESYSSDIYLKALKLPKNGRLEKDNTYSFLFHAPQAEALALITSEKEWIYFEDNGGEYGLDFIPQIEGEISIAYKQQGQSKFNIILEYEIVGANETI